MLKVVEIMDKFLLHRSVNESYIWGLREMPWW